MKQTFLLITLIMTFVSCTETAQQKEYNLDIKNDLVSSDNYKTNIKTDFPENSLFTITVSRDYKRKNSTEQYAAEIYYSYSSLVKNGEINFDFKVDDQKWLTEYKTLQKENGKFDSTLTDVDFKSIKDSIEINVLYTPKANQPEESKKIIGENGENLKGKNVEKNAGFNIYTKKMKFYNKFSN